MCRISLCTINLCTISSCTIISRQSWARFASFGFACDFWFCLNKNFVCIFDFFLFLYLLIFCCIYSYFVCMFIHIFCCIFISFVFVFLVWVNLLQWCQTDEGKIPSGDFFSHALNIHAIPPLLGSLASQFWISMLCAKGSSFGIFNVFQVLQLLFGTFFTHNQLITIYDNLKNCWRVFLHVWPSKCHLRQFSRSYPCSAVIRLIT